MERESECSERWSHCEEMQRTENAMMVKQLLSGSAYG
jgi:hypothetical protein